MNIKLSFFISALLMLFLLSIFSCEGDVSTVSEDPYGPVEDAAVSFGVKWPAPAQEGAPRTMAASATNIQNECDARGVDKVRVEVKSGSGGSLKSATFDCAAGQGSLTGIEPQSGCTIVVTGLSDSGVAMYQGVHAGVTLHAGMNKIGVVRLSLIDAPEPGLGGMPPGDITNSIGMTFNYIPPGTFMMGSPEDEPGRFSDETQHQVTLTQGFYMQTTEVTQGQWKAVMGKNPSSFSNCGSDCPVGAVSWYDAQDFIMALNVIQGSDRYSLPTEAQWEYAARAGSNTAFANGPISHIDGGYDPVLDHMGWYWYNSEAGYSECHIFTDDLCRGAHPVALKEPNAWGLYDMHGNAREWVLDWYGAYPKDAVVDPTGPSSGWHRILRGGGWFSTAEHCRSASRSHGNPEDYYLSVGFRLVLIPGIEPGM